MNRRKLLVSLTGLTALIGLAFVVKVLVGSMSLNEVARNNAKIRIELSRIPDVGALVVDYHWHKALVVKNPELAIFLIPYWEGAYRLPDPTWESPFVACRDFIIGEAQFSCNDNKLSESWNQQAKWDFAGVNKGTWMPDLQKANFKVQGEYLILSPEYN